MIRVLVLEDTPTTTDQLTLCLQEALPGVIVETASTVDGALQQVREAIACGQFYDVVILDAKVPKSEGDNEEVHPEVCLEIGRTMPNALIVHFTAFSGDRAVEDQLRVQLQQALAGRPVLIDKNDTECMSNLLRTIQRFIFGSRIEARMDDLFGSGPAGAGKGIRTRSPAMKVAHVTQVLAALTRDISAHWTCLSEPTQTRIREVFFIEDQQQPVYVSLLPPDHAGVAGPSSHSVVQPNGNQSGKPSQ